jgi:hypothetical protein
MKGRRMKREEERNKQQKTDSVQFEKKNYFEIKQ